MKAKEIYTFKRIETLMLHFAVNNNIPTYLARSSGQEWEFGPGYKPKDGAPKWIIVLDDQFSIFLESDEFPDHLVGELLDLADGVRNSLYAMGK
ncbi:MAG: hypothetical protein V1897_17925 [Pseudomonadota bacterium]